MSNKRPTTTADDAVQRLLQNGGTKRKTPELAQSSEEVVVPTARPKVQQPTASPVPVPAWSPPEGPKNSVDVWEQMRVLLPWMEDALPRALRENVEEYASMPAAFRLQSLTPTEIHGDEKKSGSFREKWNPSNVGTSLKMHYKYEAAGCLWWTELFPQEQSLLVETSDNLDWASVLKFAEGLAMDKAAKDGMLMFDTTIACFLYPDDVAGQGLSDGFPACLPVLRAALLPAWGVLVALGQAILKQDWEHVRRLVEVTRSVRLRLHVVQNRVEAAKESIHYCEEFRKNALLQDTFVSWVGKFQTIWTSYKGTQKGALAWLRDQNVKYLNNDVNDAVLKAAKSPDCTRRMLFRDCVEGPRFAA